jgi:hypothetical protein
VSNEWARAISETAVFAMRRVDQPTGNVLGHIRGMYCPQAFDPDLLALPSTGLLLSQRYTNILWSFQEGWFHA